MQATIKILKVCHNKGNARIWIEGKRLTNAGYSRGMTFTRSIDSLNNLVLSFDHQGKPHGRIAGTETRPIIDLCGKWVTAFMADADHYCVTLQESEITINPIRKN